MKTLTQLFSRDRADPNLVAGAGPAWVGDDGVHGCECALPFLTGIQGGWPASAEAAQGNGAASVSNPPDARAD